MDYKKEVVYKRENFKLGIFLDIRNIEYFHSLEKLSNL